MDPGSPPGVEQFVPDMSKLPSMPDMPTMPGMPEGMPDVGGAFSGAMSDVTGGVGGAFSGAMDGISGITPDMPTIPGIPEGMPDVGGALSGAMSGVTDGVGGAMSGVTGVIPTEIPGVGGMPDISGAMPDLSGVTDSARGLRDSVTAMDPGLGDAAQEAATAAAEAAAAAAEAAQSVVNPLEKHHSVVGGTLSVGELENVVQRFGQTQDRLKQVYGLDLPAFKGLVQELCGADAPNDRDLKAAFVVADQNKNGVIELDEFIHLFELIKKKKVVGIGGGVVFSSSKQKSQKQTFKKELQAARESQEMSIADAMNPVNATAAAGGGDELARQVQRQSSAL